MEHFFKKIGFISPSGVRDVTMFCWAAGDKLE